MTGRSPLNTPLFPHGLTCPPRSPRAGGKRNRCRRDLQTTSCLRYAPPHMISALIDHPGLHSMPHRHVMSATPLRAGAEAAAWRFHPTIPLRWFAVAGFGCLELQQQWWGTIEAFQGKFFQPHYHNLPTCISYGHDHSKLPLFDPCAYAIALFPHPSMPTSYPSHHNA